MMKTLLISVVAFLLVTTSFGAQKERKFELLDDLDDLIVVFINEPEGVPTERSDLPNDLLQLWNGAALKVSIDGGSNDLLKLNRSGKLERPDLIIGDMDTISAEAKQYFESDSDVKLHKVENQDKTDLEKAMDIIFEKIRTQNKSGGDGGQDEYEGILLLGGIHGRFDLTMANLNAMMMHVNKFPDIPIMALDGINFLVLLPSGKTKLELNSMECTGKSGLIPLRQRQTKVFTKGFQWNLGKQGAEGKEPERQAIEFGGKLSCSNKIESPNDLCVDSTEPVLFTVELKKPNCVLSKEKKGEKST